MILSQLAFDNLVAQPSRLILVALLLRSKFQTTNFLFSTLSKLGKGNIFY